MTAKFLIQKSRLRLSTKSLSVAQQISTNNHKGVYLLTGLFSVGVGMLKNGWKSRNVTEIS